MTIITLLLVGLLILLAGPLSVAAFGPVNIKADWRQASHASSGLAPAAATTPEAVVQVYAARAFAWRGAFAVHTWIAAKPAGADRFTRYEVIGWNLHRGGSAVSVSSQRPPDAEWFGATPWLVRDLRGAAADAVLAGLEQAVATYPYADRYQAWPGPNSNTFIAHIGRQIPALGLIMPALAVGKDYLPSETGRAALFATSPGGGWQISASGVAGVLVGPREGMEVNILGLVFAINPLDLSLAIPGVGRLGAGSSARASAPAPESAN